MSRGQRGGRRKPEIMLIEQYWRYKKRPAIVYELPLVRGSRSKDQGSRRLDALLVLDAPCADFKWSARKPPDLTCKKLEIVQAKVGRLGMSLMGQTLFSRMLFKKLVYENKWEPTFIRCVALCQKGDHVLGALCREFGVDVITQASGFEVVN